MIKQIVFLKGTTVEEMIKLFPTKDVIHFENVQNMKTTHIEQISPFFICGQEAYIVDLEEKTIYCLDADPRIIVCGEQRK